MFDTTDLTSYIPGYERYCESMEKEVEYDNSDEIYEEMKLKGESIMKQRKIINLKTTKMTWGEVLKLENYIWKNDKLVPVEMLEGK